ncbi:MAG: desulfoferrodoxin [Candidatus Pacearchaeota archaeon]|nr:desulfoferrodoxin [Candidatus Pacearchaeota archaeon]
MVEVLHNGVGTLVCCGKPMKLQIAKTKEEGKEKHVPIIEKNKEGVKIKVGSVPHPMIREHHIEWIEVSTENGESKKFLKPGDKPEAMFPVKNKVKSREYCNIHGLWKDNENKS